MKEPTWLDTESVLAIHASMIEEFGGSDGLRDNNLLESALARARQIWSYGDKRTLPMLGAAYAFDILRNQPFFDGNKRTALIVLYVFLRRNGRRLVAPEIEANKMFVALAAGEVEENMLSDWVKKWSKRDE